jgi:hypothetical protein
MQHGDIAREVAEQALALLAHHVPKDIQIGRPLAAFPDPEHHDAARVLTDTALWWVYEHEVDRLVEIGTSTAELTTFRNGQETCRKVAPMGYDSEQEA